MRLHSCIAAALACLMLVACGDRRRELPAAEVIRRTVLQSQLTDSVVVSLTADISLMGRSTLLGHVVGSGVVRSANASWSMDLALQAQSDEGRSLSGAVLLSSPSRGALYLFLKNLTGSGMVRPLPVSGSWWLVFRGSGSTTGFTTPDPTLAGRLSSAVVVESGGLTAQGSEYHYSIHVADNVLRELVAVPDGAASRSVPLRDEGQPSVAPVLSGDIRIDAETFRLQDIRWHVADLKAGEWSGEADVHMQFSHFNNAPPIQLPSGPTVFVPLETIYAIISGD